VIGQRQAGPSVDGDHGGEGVLHILVVDAEPQGLTLVPKFSFSSTPALLRHSVIGVSDHDALVELEKVQGMTADILRST
jgi:hypothetical protein